MKQFMDKDFLLKTETAKHLYHNFSENQPIIDYHCHIDAAEIAENKVFENITQVWLGGDHYKWRAMRICGIDERYITGDASDYEKFKAFSSALPKMVGSPLYHWAHLELKKYFDIHEPLSGKTCDAIWEACNNKLKVTPARTMIKLSNVTIICTTNDPTDTLKHHRAIAADSSFKTKVFPAFRPDKAVNIDKAGFHSYIAQLAAVCGKQITNLEELKCALLSRIEFFHENDCRAADHGMDYVPFKAADDKTVDEIFKKALSGGEVSVEDAEAYKTTVILFCGKQYARLGWVMELHFGVIRNTNTKQFAKLGPDTGYDTVGVHNDADNLAKLLNALEQKDSLPKTLLFPIDAGKNAVCNTIAGSFQQAGIFGKVQQGSAWWFNDTKIGMETQLKSFSDLSVLGGFVGMLTDSRSFLSYTRHEYFRRILCNYIGELVENGEYPNDLDVLGEIAADISYGNAKRFFDWAR